MSYLCTPFLGKERELSSVGLEHLPYKQGVVGSNPSAPTMLRATHVSPLQKKTKGPVAQLNRVSDYGSEGSRFESWRDHRKKQKRLIITKVTRSFFVFAKPLPNIYCFTTLIACSPIRKTYVPAGKWPNRTVSFWLVMRCV